MKYSAKQQTSTARAITRKAEQKIKSKTGVGYNLVLCPEYLTKKTPEQMLKVVAGSLGMDTACYSLKTRARPVVELRFIAAYFLRNYFPGITLLQITHFFGNQDHTSIINGISRANTLIAIGDDQFTKKYETVLNSVNQWLRKEVLGYESAISA